MKEKFKHHGRAIYQSARWRALREQALRRDGFQYVRCGARVRKDFGDIAALAASIDEIGLLQPIGIDADYRLVFGERRLRAFQQLGRDTIPTRIVNIESLVRGEYAENEIRKDFTPSERVEIGRALEAQLAGRAGNPNFGDAPIRENFPELPKGGSRALAGRALLRTAASRMF